jgi:hypothetical protein
MLSSAARSVETVCMGRQTGSDRQLNRVLVACCEWKEWTEEVVGVQAVNMQGWQ